MLGVRYRPVAYSRNAIVHGNDQTISHQDRKRILLLVGAMYRELRPQVRHRVHEIFTMSEEEMMHQPIHNQVTWLKRLKFLFPDQSHTIDNSMRD